MRNLKLNPFYRFILISFLCYLVWFVLYDLWLKKVGYLDNVLGYSTTVIVIKLMTILHYDATYQESNQLYFFYNNGVKLLQMVPACNGQVLYPLFAGFILATPGIGKVKIKYILVGSLLIYFVNVARVFALVLLKIHMPLYLSFNHKYTFTVIVYGFIFGLWLIWIKYFVAKEKNEEIN